MTWDAGDQILADGGQTGVGTNRQGRRPAQFDAVVCRRVVACSEHRTRAIQQARREIQLVGGRQPDAHDVQTLTGHPGGECGGQRRGTVAHVVTDRDLAGAPGAHQSSEGGADIGDQGLVDLFADQAAHVISLDDTVDSLGGPRHARYS
jgi:hypothetical protein